MQEELVPIKATGRSLYLKITKQETEVVVMNPYEDFAPQAVTQTESHSVAGLHQQALDLISSPNSFNPPQRWITEPGLLDPPGEDLAKIDLSSVKISIDDILEQIRGDNEKCGCIDAPVSSENKRNEQVKASVESAENSLYVLNCLDNNLEFTPSLTFEQTKDLQKALLNGNPEDVGKFLRGLPKEELQKVVSLLGRNLSSMNSYFSASLDENGNLMLMDEKTNRGILFDGVSAGVISRGIDGTIITEKCFDPDAAEKLATILRNRIIEQDSLREIRML